MFRSEKSSSTSHLTSSKSKTSSSSSRDQVPSRPSGDGKKYDKRRDQGLVKGISNLSVNDSSTSSSRDSGRRRDDRYESSPSARGGPRDKYSSSRDCPSRSHPENQHSRLAYSHKDSDSCHSHSSRHNHPDVQYSSRSERGYATEANPGYKDVPRGSSAGNSSARVTRSKAEGKKVASGRVEKPLKKSKGSKKPRPKSKSPSPPTKGRNQGNLDVVIYNPRSREGNIPHWSFFVENNNHGRGVIRDVIGEPMNFRRNRADNVRPDHSELYRERIEVGEIDDVQNFEDILDSQPISNDVAGWSCQDYIIEALEELCEQGLVQDYTYDEARQRLDRRLNRGASSDLSA